MNHTPISKEAKRLSGLGFAILWLHPKSKRPVGVEWARGPRKTWDELKLTYEEGYNVGVRLGTPSQLDNGFLAVIDVDIKSKDIRHQKEALAALREIVGKVQCPEVRSGRGFGSRHLYCVTEKPFKTWNPAVSSEVVKVHMPSKMPSKKELETLSKDEIKEGMRLSKAWEISLYSEGRQVVLPPSIHPDSGQPYRWLTDKIESIEQLPLLDLGGAPETKEEITPHDAASYQAGVIDFEIDETLDVRWLPDLDEKTRKLIVNGLWNGKRVEDESAYLLPAASGLISHGLDIPSVLTILTDKNTVLGECAYRHAQTTNRKRAALWLWNYTVKKVMKERDPALAFENVPIESTPLTGDALAEQSEEFREKSELKGFHCVGARGALKPDFEALLKEFERVHPYKTIADMKTVYVFNGTHYTDLTHIEGKGFAEEKLDPKPEEKTRVEFWSKVLANNITRRSFFTETTEGKLNFKNGVLDLNESAELQPHSAHFGFRGLLPYEYQPDAKCPVFKEWLRGVMLGDVELTSILQEYMGYVIRGGEYKYHKALWLGGVGRNGKSTFVDVLKALIGAGNFSTISIKALMADKFAGADLDGKIANFSEETSPQELSDSGPFKNLTGDGDLFAQKKYGDPYNFRNRAKLIMTYNTIPDLKDLSAGMLSRPLIIPFDKIIAEDEQDRNIKKKLFEELPGIFNFALEGWRRLEEQQGFTKSAKSILALKKVKEESCPVYQWVEDHIVFEKVNFGDESLGREFRPVELHTVYQRGERYPFKPIEFYRRLNSHPRMRLHKIKNQTGAIYRGIEIR